MPGSYEYYTDIYQDGNAYIKKGDLIKALRLSIRLRHKIFVDVFEVRNGYIFFELFV